MKIMFLFILFIVQITPLSVFAQNTTSLTPDAVNQHGLLLNNPVMVSPVNAIPLGRNWFRLETDIHVFIDQVNFQQIAGVLLDLENQDKIYNGKKNKLTATIVNRSADETIVDFVSIDIGPFGIQFKTPYRSSVKTIIHTDTKIGIEFMQLASDNSTNKDIKNFNSTQYAEEVIINGIKYIYIRIYTTSDVNASILPGAKSILEKEAGPVNIEGMQMIINAAKNTY